MKFLADENFPRVALLLPRKSGFDVAAVAETSPGLPDREVLSNASAEGRTLLAFDKDFGELAFRRGMPSLVRSHPVLDWATHAIGNRGPRACHLTVGRSMGWSLLRRDGPQDSPQCPAVTRLSSAAPVR